MKSKRLPAAASILRIQTANGSRFENHKRADATGRPRQPNNVVVQLSFGLAAVLAIEPFHAARGVDQFLFAGEEGVAGGTYLEADLRLGRTSLPSLATRAMDGRVHVFWMNIGLHLCDYSCCEFFCRRNVKN